MRLVGGLMRINVFKGDGSTFDIAAEKAQDNLIDYCKANFITGNDVISLSPAVTENQFGYDISLWLLLK